MHDDVLNAAKKNSESHNVLCRRKLVMDMTRAKFLKMDGEVELSKLSY